MSFVHYSRFKTIYSLVLRIKFWQCQLYLKIRKSRSGHVTKQKEVKRQNCLDPKLSFCPTHFIAYLYAMHNDIEMCSSLIFLNFFLNCICVSANYSIFFLFSFMCGKTFMGCIFSP